MGSRRLIPNRANSSSWNAFTGTQLSFMLVNVCRMADRMSNHCTSRISGETRSRSAWLNCQKDPSLTSALCLSRLAANAALILAASKLSNQAFSSAAATKLYMMLETFRIGRVCLMLKRWNLHCALSSGNLTWNSSSNSIDVFAMKLSLRGLLGGFSGLHRPARKLPLARVAHRLELIRAAPHPILAFALAEQSLPTRLEARAV
mmetsp:Transcript_41521/g.134043  ORF Transcript_41521/g.134043 Transcript_41521/m.134043 type:complete len:204 (+) Transcript_41521:359-970(+)